MYGGVLYLLENIKVKNIVIGKQFEKCENLEKFLKILEDNDINLIIVEEGQMIQLEKDLYFEILWPNKANKIEENCINNNALVCKLCYKKFSMLFTGDIEETAERILSTKYEKSSILKSTILKVGHHGSKTSSTQNFLDLVNPKIALIGVGKDNTFGHPNDEVIERLLKMKCKVYRTDKNGEISIKINNEGDFKINKYIE